MLLGATSAWIILPDLSRVHLCLHQQSLWAQILKLLVSPSECTSSRVSSHPLAVDFSRLTVSAAGRRRLGEKTWSWNEADSQSIECSKNPTTCSILSGGRSARNYLFLSPLPSHTHTQRLHSANGECERLFIKLLFIAQRAEQQLGVTFRSIRGEMQRAKIMALLTEKSCRPLCRIVLRRINLSAIEGELHRKRRKGEHWMKKEKQKDRKNRLDDKCCSASGEERTETLMFFCSCLLEVQW